MSFQIIFDCADPGRLAEFWSTALGYRRAETTATGAGLLPPRDGAPSIAFFKVPEPKTAKNRVHLDLRVPNLDEEVARLRSLGASVVSDRYSEAGADWFVMTDPEGNEFCVATGWV